MKILFSKVDSPEKKQLWTYSKNKTRQKWRMLRRINFRKQYFYIDIGVKICVAQVLQEMRRLRSDPNYFDQGRPMGSEVLAWLKVALFLSPSLSLSLSLSPSLSPCLSLPLCLSLYLSLSLTFSLSLSLSPSLSPSPSLSLPLSLSLTLSASMG
jgi:hypothetical protein